MFSVLCFVVALSMVALFLRLAYQKRNHLSEATSFILIGTFLSTFFMVLPTEWVSEGETVFCKPLHAILSSLLYSLKTLSGRQSIEQLESMALPGFFKGVYIVVNYILFALAPILVSSLILSFLGDTGEKIRYFLSRAPKCYVFSEVNKSSVTLAKGIKATKEKKTIVFCNAKGADKELMAEARKYGGILLYKNCKDLKLYRWCREYEFCFLSEREDENIELTQQMIAQEEKLEGHTITINAFAHNSTNIQLLESMYKKKPCAVFESAHKELLDKAIEISGYAPNTRFVFFGISEENERLAAFAKNHSVETYEGHWSTTQVDESFREYDPKLYYLKEKDGKPKVAQQELDYSENHLVTQWQDEPVRIRFVDEVALFCNNWLFEHPLYDLPEDKKEIFVLLVGGGRLGKQMLRTIAWYGQIDGYTLKIRVLDKTAKRIENEMRSLCPELMEYDIAFEDVQVESLTFDEKVEEYKDATFVWVATGSDDLNIATAENIFRILRRHYSEETPPIVTRVRDDMKSKNFLQKGSYLKDRNIQLFGTMSSVFANDKLFNSELENLAFAVHLCYNWALDADKDSIAYQKALHSFYTSEYNRRSSMATALHIPAKLRSCTIIGRTSTMPTDAQLEAYRKLIEDEGKRLKLVKNEHERWNAFMRSEGFRSVGFDEVKGYVSRTRSHKDDAAKLHPCIVGWEELDILQEKYDQLQKELNLKKSNFKEYDEKIVVEIPEILKKARELAQEGW